MLTLFSLPLYSQWQDYEKAVHGGLHWQTLETKHFLVHYHDGAERTARVIAQVAEDIYGPVTTLYEHEPDQKVSFAVIDYEDNSNGAAYFYDNKILIWAPALDFDLRGTHNWLRNVIVHEFTHIIQIQTSMKFGRKFPGIYLQWLNYEEERRQDVLYGYPNTVVSYPLSGFIIPSWFAEGVAQYNRPEMSYDYWDSHRDMILRSYVLDSNMLSWNEMSVFGKTSLGNESSYNAGFALSKYLSETYGQDIIPKIAKNISRTNMVTMDQSIERTIGKTGQQIYDEWKNYLTSDYRKRVEKIESNKVEGTRIADVGFGNMNPAFSPDGEKIAYISNKETDYFGLSSIYIYDVNTKEEKMLVAGVRSTLSWSSDGQKIYYSKLTDNQDIGFKISDLFVYDLENEEEIQLTKGLRAANPSLSSDGKLLSFAVGNDGTMNVGISDTTGGNFHQITSYKSGEQIYLPKWSPDGKNIVFGYAFREEQDIASVNIEIRSVDILVDGTPDDRNPVYSADGKYLYFVSDRTGIFNVYKLNVATKEVTQVTNVLGGAFTPSLSDSGKMAYSLYTSRGFKINYLVDSISQDLASSHYLEPERIRRPEIKIDDSSLKRNQFDFVALRNYDDTKVSNITKAEYKNIYSSLSIIPFLRIDNYNSKSSGLDFLKPGFYFISGDVIEKMQLFGGAAINHIFERDLFLQFEYRDKIFGLYQLGLLPTASVEVYNVSRKRTGEKITIVEQFEETSADITYSLFEFDFFLTHPVFAENSILRLGYTYSQYSNAISSFLVKSSALLVPASSDIYFKGNNFSLQYSIKGILPARTREINPSGRSFALRLDNEFNHFTTEDSTGASEFEATDTGIKLKLVPYTIRRAEFRYTEHLPLPLWKHTLSFTLRGGTIFGQKVPDFFDFYAGGLVGMKGYPFYSISGNEIASLNIAYRFPIWENIDIRIFQLYFDRFYGEFHADLGNAWNGLPNIRDFKKDAGFELRLEAFSWYAYPTRIFFNGTYGLDSFTYDRRNVKASYGKEWRFYFGVLFGFDFSNDIKRMLGDFHEW
ncbi:MAG: biopolymer transporter Tol [Bacteroidota bacterium]|nr:biopolymer transporter Tol [Bacteroidota bacterium]